MEKLRVQHQPCYIYRQYGVKLVNTFTATGRLASDANLSKASGTSVSNFRIASEAGYGKHQKTLWIDCSLWGPKADALHQYLLKSKHVLISGELTTKDYKRKDGTQGHGFSLTVDRIEFIGTKKYLEDVSHDKKPSYQNHESQGLESKKNHNVSSEPAEALSGDTIWNR